MRRLTRTILLMIAVTLLTVTTARAATWNLTIPEAQSSIVMFGQGTAPRATIVAAVDCTQLSTAAVECLLYRSIFPGFPSETVESWGIVAARYSATSVFVFDKFYSPWNAVEPFIP